MEFSVSKLRGAESVGREFVGWGSAVGSEPTNSG